MDLSKERSWCLRQDDNGVPLSQTCTLRVHIFIGARDSTRDAIILPLRSLIFTRTVAERHTIYPFDSLIITSLMI